MGEPAPVIRRLENAPADDEELEAFRRALHSEDSYLAATREMLARLITSLDAARPSRS